MPSPSHPKPPTPTQIAAAADKTVPPILAPNLTAIFIGINPGLYSAATGHHFARPGNRFWPALHKSGWTDRLLSPYEDRRLLDSGIGITNIAGRATASAAELSPDELTRGGRALAARLRRYRPRAAIFLGIGAYATAFNQKRVAIGRQPIDIAGIPVWVLPNPSGLNANYQLDDLVRLFADLRRELTDR